MRPDLEYLYSKFHYYNGLCFNGRLSSPEIRLNTRRGALGLTRRAIDRETGKEKIWIEISVRHDLPEEEYLDTLVHEMIHYYIWSSHIADDGPHGSVFRAEMKRINVECGVRTTQYYENPEGELVNTRGRVRFICVVRMRDGLTGVAVVAKNNVLAFWDEFYRIPEAEDVEWYVSDREIFAQYPQRPVPTLYHLPQEKVEGYLQGARRLIRDGDSIMIEDI